MENYNKHLLFKRQYIIGTKKVNIYEGSWTSKKITNKLYLNIHNDLNYTHFANEKKSLTLIGYVLDPFNSHYTNFQITEYLFNKINSFDELINLTTPLSGRWIFILNLNGETRFFNDPSSSRTLYYYKNLCNPLIGSSQSIINYLVEDKEKNDGIQKKYLESDYYNHNENAWYGNKTVYENIYHLLPNHFLDLDTMEVNRFWVNLDKDLNMNEILEKSSTLLKSSIQAINFRTDTMLAVTAGIDSRILLAASKEFSKDIYYFVDAPDNNLSHPDVYIPMRLADSNNFKFNIHTYIPENSKEFNLIMEKNLHSTRKLAKTTSIEYYYNNFKNKILISGNASGMAKSVYGKTPIKTKEKNVKFLMNATGIPTYLEYVEIELESWLENIHTEEMGNINILDLFYWEQRMGNWGSQYFSELDIAMDSFMPFNNRLLILTMLKADEKTRMEPSYLLYNNLIKDMWEELLNQPINPIGRIRKIKKSFKKILPNKIINILQSYIVKIEKIMKKY